ncbi:hypothetical protein ACFW6E_42510 [Streptomyces olivaceoviridis]|uniref:hypothetical protein n=1 Tax=Streptomyces olivaceoviridis TaxID=1921 RepID=UPI00368C7BA1
MRPVRQPRSTGPLPAPTPVAYVDNPLDLYDPIGPAPCRKEHYTRSDGAGGRGGSIRYKPHDPSAARPASPPASAPEIPDTGTEAGGTRPPGWCGNGNAFNEARGHPLANRLGGAGTRHNTRHNLVAQTNNPTNSPYQRDLVEYTAYGNRGFELAGRLGNPAAGVHTAIPGWRS